MHFVESFFNKNDIVSNTWTETFFEASALEKNFHQSVSANIKPRGLESTPIESPHRKVEHWLQNTTLYRQTNSTNETTCLESTDVNDNKMTVSNKEPDGKVDSGSIKCSEEVLTTNEGSSQLLVNKGINKGSPSNQCTKNPKQSMHYKSYSDTDDYMANPAVQSTGTETDANEQEGTSCLDEEIVSNTLAMMNPEALNRLQCMKGMCIPNDVRIPYSVNIWDHSGQNEFIMLNQLFLNVDAFIIMVMDISLGLNVPLRQSSDEKGNFGIPETPAQTLCYWLNALHILTIEKSTEPNIALVLTHKDMIQTDDTKKKYIDRYIDDLFESICEKPYAAYIKKENIFVVDNKEGTEGDFADVRNKIFNQMTRQNSWGIEQPTEWLKLEADILEKAQQNEKPYLDISTVKNLASTFAMNEKDLESFLSFLHSLGDLIYYSDFVVMNFQWFVDMIKFLMTPEAFKRHLKKEIMEELKKGIMSDESLKVIWEENDVQFLKDVMIKLDLMLPLGTEYENQKCLIPCLLPFHEVQIAGPDSITDKTLVYSRTLEPKHGDIMPVGTFHKLLAQCSKMPGWNICIDHNLSYTQALIEIDDGVCMELRHRNSNSIDLNIRSSRDTLYDDGYSSFNDPSDLSIRTHDAIDKVLEISGLTQKGDSKMLHRHRIPRKEYASLAKAGENEVPQDTRKKYTMHTKELEVDGKF